MSQLLQLEIRGLKERVLTEPDINFLQLREWALGWTDLSEFIADIDRVDSQLIAVDSGAVMQL